MDREMITKDDEHTLETLRELSPADHAAVVKDATVAASDDEIKRLALLLVDALPNIGIFRALEVLAAIGWKLMETR